MEPVIQVDNLRKRYGSHVAVEDVSSFQVRRGEIFGLLGRNGAGKTTTGGMRPGAAAPGRAIRERGATVVLVTHYMDEAEQLCDGSRWSTADRWSPPTPRRD
jgi:ABC-type multidrug transport system ATPase subunit